MYMLQYLPVMLEQSSAKRYSTKENYMDGACSTNGGNRKCIRILGRKPEQKRPLCRLVVDVKIIIIIIIIILIIINGS
jgi:hypothetical protein